MPRPRRLRRIFFEPEVGYFKPAGVPIARLEEVVLSKDELEALRLIDFEERDQNEVAKRMDVSQPTLSRLLKSARKKTSEALVKGKAIKIEGGDVEFVRGRGFGFRRGFGRGSGRF